MSREYLDKYNYPPSREEAVLAAMSVREEDIDCSDIPEISDDAIISPAGPRFREIAKRNLAVLNNKLKVS